MEMIFPPEHIEKILAGEKWQTRRLRRGLYMRIQQYALQSGRGKSSIPGYRIIFDRITFENGRISPEDAIAEGGYTPEEFETLFHMIYPRWNGDGRWVFAFHLIRAMQ